MRSSGPGAVRPCRTPAVCARRAAAVPVRSRIIWPSRRASRRPRAKPWREMPRRVQPYGSAVDAESAGLAHGRPGSVPGGGYELGSTLTAREVAQQAAEAVAELNELTAAGADAAGLDDVRDVVDSLRRMIAGLPRLCEQLARIIVVQ